MLQKVELRVPICKGYILQRITAFKGIRPNVVTIYCHFLQFIAMVKQPISGSSPGIAAIHLHILRNMNTERTRSGFHPAVFPEENTLRGNRIPEAVRGGDGRIQKRHIVSGRGPEPCQSDPLPVIGQQIPYHLGHGQRRIRRHGADVGAKVGAVHAGKNNRDSRLPQLLNRGSKIFRELFVTMTGMPGSSRSWPMVPMLWIWIGELFRSFAAASRNPAMIS